MTAGVLLMTVAGLLLVGGAVGVLAAVLRAPAAPVVRVRRGATAQRRGRRGPLLLGGAVAGTAALLLTGWPVAGLGVAGAVVYLPTVLGGAAAARQMIVRSEALAAWTRRLADLIASGAAGSTVEALRRSALSAPEPIAGPVEALAARMGPQGTEVALRRFADDIGDVAADKIAMVLILRERNGGRGLAEVLTGLAADLDERARMVREVEAERAKPRANMRTIVAVTAVLVLGMLLFTREFLAAYGSLFGQLALVLVVGLFALSLRWMRALAEPIRPTRVLVERAGGAEVAA